jgi:formate dehydrogenase subunit gamma
VLILSIIVHIYAGIWIKGSIGAMLHGWVSRAWARKHHELWYRDVTGDKTPGNHGRKKDDRLSTILEPGRSKRRQ